MSAINTAVTLIITVTITVYVVLYNIKCYMYLVYLTLCAFI